MESSSKSHSTLTSLEKMVSSTCFCKLRERCEDKNSSECMRNRNVYAEFMAMKRQVKR
jgi:hypothetical protein